MKYLTILSTLAIGSFAQTIVDLVNQLSSAHPPEFTVLKRLVLDQPEILSALSNAGAKLTVFAPTDAAFAAAGVNASDKALVADVLKYHVLNEIVKSQNIPALVFAKTLLTNPALVQLPNKEAQVLAVSNKNGSVTIRYGLGTATVVKADVMASNGVIHVIDKVLIPPKTPSKTATEAGLSTLVSLLVKTELAAAVDGLVGATIFAPTNAAFAKYDFSRLSVKQVADVLKYHVVNAVAYSTKLPSSAKTLQGSSVSISAVGTTVKVNNATVAITDVLVSNGVVHVIDDVLLPPNCALQGNIVIQTGTSAGQIDAGSAASSVQTGMWAIVALGALLLA